MRANIYYREGKKNFMQFSKECLLCVKPICVLFLV